MEWLIPFKGRKRSADAECNFLAREGNIYVMDNHLLALWCWFQHLKQHGGPYNFLHIDAHDDCDPALARSWRGEGLADMSLEDYRRTGVRWDNYVPVFLEHYKSMLGLTVGMTHGLGIKGAFAKTYDCYDVLKHLDDLLLMNKKWVLNVDFDYFFARSFKAAPMFSEAYVREVFKLIKLNYDMGHIEVLTACLSPECCGGWVQAESVLAIFFEEMGLAPCLGAPDSGRP